MRMLQAYNYRIKFKEISILPYFEKWTLKTDSLKVCPYLVLDLQMPNA